MKIRDLTYEEAMRLYPDQVAEVVLKLRSGKSKSKNTPWTELAWSYACCVEVNEGSTLEQVFMRLENPAEMSGEARVADEVARTIVWLEGRIGRWTGKSSRIATPPEVAANVRKSWEKRAAEEARAAALSPEERDSELTDLLRALGKGGGFMGFMMRK